MLSYTARLSGAVAGSIQALPLTNTVVATYTSLPDKPWPDQERTYGPITATASITPAAAETGKTVVPASGSTHNLKVGDLVTYTLGQHSPARAGSVVALPIRRSCPLGFRYVTGSLSVSTNMLFSGNSVLATGTTFASATDAGDAGVEGTVAITNTQCRPSGGRPGPPCGGMVAAAAEQQCFNNAWAGDRDLCFSVVGYQA